MTLLWLDLETPGLSPYMGIVEVAWQVTTTELQPLTDVRSHVITPTDQQLRWIAENDVVFDMHTRSGLLDDLKRKAYTIRRDVAEMNILSDLSQFLQPGEVVQLAGASVHFDKRFIEMWMPALDQRLHHRVYDTSTLKTFFENIGIEHGVDNDGQHRAANDVREVLAVAQRYRNWALDVKGMAMLLMEPGEL